MRRPTLDHIDRHISDVMWRIGVPALRVADRKSVV